MGVKLLKDYLNEVTEIKHALRIDGTHEENVKVVKKYNKKVRLEVPIGELIDQLAGFAWAWKMQGRVMDTLPITNRDRFNAQGLEGKVSVEMSLYDALFVAMQARPYRVQIIDCKPARS